MESTKTDGSAQRPVRLAYLVSHPIQYQAPLLRRIAQEKDIELTVLFGSDFSVRDYKDEGFGVGVKWDVPLLEGYQHEFLPNIRDTSGVSVTSPVSHGIISRLRGNKAKPGFDVLWVHGYATINAMQGILAANMLGIPVLLRAESWLRDRARTGPKLAAKNLFFSILKRLIDATLPIGTLNSAYWTYYFGTDFPQFLMPYAVDNQYFQQQSLAAVAGRAELLAELDLDPSRPVILFASKLQYRKHCDDLLEAYTRLSPGKGIEPLPYLVIVGDGEHRKQLESEAAATGLKSIRFCGFRNQSELPRFFDIASVFVLPSRHEPWGLIVNEVMNAGRAVIISDDVGCQPDLIEDGVQGAIFPVRDIDALTDALRRVLATPETASNMGQHALARIQHWSFEQDIQGLRQAIATVTGKLTA
jgi:glycosyltransferase involved in cell wall biosynthesis